MTSEDAGNERSSKPLDGVARRLGVRRPNANPARRAGPSFAAYPFGAGASAPRQNFTTGPRA